MEKEVPMCEWKNSMILKLKDISELSDNWNGYDAKPISQKVILNSKEMISGLNKGMDISPTACDSIQFECEKSNGKYFEAEVFDDHIEIFTVTSDGKEEEFSIEVNINKLNDQLSRNGWTIS